MTASLPSAAAMLASDFATIPDLVAAHARERPDRIALAVDGAETSYATLDTTMNRIAAALHVAGVEPGRAVAMMGANSIPLAVAFLAVVRAGCVATPLATSITAEQAIAMLDDCGAPILFADAAARTLLDGHALGVTIVDLDLQSIMDWASSAPPVVRPVAIGPDDPFNIIYSSGTTGVPKGIVQPHAMRWAHVARNAAAGFDTAVTMIATPLYSNTTLVSFLPTIAWGGTAVLLPRFDAATFVALAQRYRATHAMLVPVQYRRLMALPDFDRYDLSAFRLKTCTSAPFEAALKAEVLARWPGLLIEYYGMTEGGGTTVLNCNAYPDKLGTVGRPVEGHDIRLIDEAGSEVPIGTAGEVVGRSPAMMSGYHNRTAATLDAEWFDGEGRRYIRHGDIGRFDADAFLTLIDRKKDVIISGGFNLYPSDLEAALCTHPAVAECAVIGVPSDRWGETPVGVYVASPGSDDEPAAILEWVNARLGRTQRLSALHRLDSLPRSAIGKVLKRELRDSIGAAA